MSRTTTSATELTHEFDGEGKVVLRKSRLSMVRVGKHGDLSCQMLGLLPSSISSSSRESLTLAAFSCSRHWSSSVSYSVGHCVDDPHGGRLASPGRLSSDQALADDAVVRDDEPAEHRVNRDPSSIYHSRRISARGRMSVDRPGGRTGKESPAVNLGASASSSLLVSPPKTRSRQSKRRNQSLRTRQRSGCPSDRPSTGRRRLDT
jgi:hypothetical protein